MRRLVGVAVAAVVLAAACGGDGEAPSERVEERGHQLEDAPLRPDEAPEGLQESDRGTGPVAGLREVLPPRRTAPGLPPLPRDLIRSFEAGYQRLFTGGPRSAASSALRFGDTAAATRFFDLLGTVHDVTVADEGLLPAAGVGEAAYAWEHVEPGAQSAGAVWRRGDLVLTLALSGPVGETSVDDAMALAARVDGRLG